MRSDIEVVAMENAIRQAKSSAISRTAFELASYSNEYKTEEHLDIVVNAAALGIVTSLGGTVTETAEAIKNKMTCE